MSNQRTAYCDCRARSIVRSISTPISPTPELIHTNNIPSQSQAESIYPILSAVKSDAAELDMEIGRLKAALHDSQQKRYDLHVFAKEHNALISSNRRLPSEMWSKIFEHSRPDGDEDNIARSLADCFPMPLTRVCRRWRYIVISTSQLWTRIKLVSESDWILIHCGRLLETWLSRSREQPLETTLAYLGSRSGDDLVASTRPALKMLLSNSNRWKSFSYMLSSEMAATLAPVKHQLSKLQSLAINVDPPFLPMGRVETAFDIFEVAPLLRHLQIGPYLDLGSLKVPWAQLHDFDIIYGEYPLQKCLMALDKAPNLRRCNLALAESQLHSTLPMIILEHMQTFKLYEDKPTTIFNCISMPTLYHFSYMMERDPWPQADFISFISQFSSSLRVLDLTNAISTPQLVECLRLLPMLKEFSYGKGCLSSALTSAFFAQLVCTEEGEVHTSCNCLVPKLETLKFICFRGFDEDGFISMLTSRWAKRSGGHCLGHVRIYHSESWSIERLDARLQELKSQGFTMDVGIKVLDEDEYEIP